MTILTGHCTVSRQDVVVDTVHKHRPFTIFQLAVHSVDTVENVQEDTVYWPGQCYS